MIETLYQVNDLAEAIKYNDRLVKENKELYKEIKRLKNINEEHRELNGMIRKELQKKENIIKEVREYLNKNEIEEVYLDCKLYETEVYKDILEILDKGE